MLCDVKVAVLFPQFRILGIYHFDNIVIVLGSGNEVMKRRSMDSDFWHQLTAPCERTTLAWCCAVGSR